MTKPFNNTLELILNTMDLPRQRVVPANLSNVRWLLRNMWIQNSNLLGYNEAMKILKKELEVLEKEER